MIAVQPNYSGRELLAVIQSGHEFYKGEPTDPTHTVVGTVEWCEKFLEPVPVPNYYPKWAEHLLFRDTWETDDWPLGKRVFIKPSDAYKRFDGFVTNKGYKGKRRGAYVCSEVVDFAMEWRYYIAAGKVLASGWYDGLGEDQPPPNVTEFPENVYGAVDLGWMITGELAIVEYQHPYACGWYGESEDHDKYVEWLELGWKWLMEGNR